MAFRRRHGMLIWQVGADLHLHTVCTATAALFFQRFFMTEKQGAVDGSLVAMSCVWLASKVREEPRRLRDVINSSLAATGKRGDELQGMPMEVYWSLRDEVVLHEQMVLRAMSFDTEPTPAYMYLAEYAWLFRCPGPHANVSQVKHSVVCLAWALLNDSFCSEICAMCAPPRLALACLLLSAELGRRTPELRAEAEEFVRHVEILCRESHLRDFVGLGPESAAQVEATCRDMMSMYETFGGLSLSTLA